MPSPRTSGPPRDCPSRATATRRQPRGEADDILQSDGPRAGGPSHPARATLDPDAAFSSRVDGAEFAAWFDQGAISDDWYRWVGAVPLSRVYEVADDARARASYWGKFAEAIEGCARAPKSAYR